MNQKRVVITGLGAVTPIGNSVEEFWQNAIAGKSGAAPISRFDASSFKTQFACEVKDFEPAIHLSRKEIKRSDLYTQYGLFAATEAVKKSRIDFEALDPFDVGVIWGSGQGGLSTVETEIKSFAQNGPTPHFNPFMVPKFMPNMASGMIAMKFGLMGLNFGAVSACATSNTAIMNAFHYIKLGKGKVFIAGGSEAPISEASIGGYNALKALSQQNENPSYASRPFDVNRDGFVMGEGAGALILEEYEHAVNRNATIYAEIIGAAMTTDAYHITATHPEGKGAAKAMELALLEGGIQPNEVDYINTHATSTTVGDLSEMKAVEKVFHNSNNLKISATKSMTGHLMGGAGAVEAILSIKAINENQIPPTINTQHLDPGLPSGFNIVCQHSEEAEIKIAMSNTFGFGGHNAIVLFKECK